MNTSSIDYYINELTTTIDSDLNQTIDFSGLDIARLLDITNMITESVDAHYLLDDINTIIIDTNNVQSTYNDYINLLETEQISIDENDDEMVVEPKNQYTNDDNNDVTDIFTESVHVHYGEVDNYTIIDTNKVQATYYDAYINSTNNHFQTEEILIDENEENGC